jgi:O-antigen ligase
MRLAAAFAPGEPSDADAIVRLRSLIALCVALVLGVVAAAAAVKLSDLPVRYMAAIPAALAGLIGLPLLGSRRRARDVVVIAMTVGLSVGFSISFLLRLYVPGKFVPFLAGAEGVTISLTLVATGLFFGLWLFDQVFYAAGRRPLAYARLIWPPVLFMAAGILSLVNAADYPLAFLEEFRLLCLIGVTVAVMNFTARDVEIYLLTLAVSVMLQAGLAVMQYGTGSSLGLSLFGEAAPVLAGVDFETVARPTGLFGDPNIMAYFFEITAPMLLALCLVTENQLKKLIYLVATLAALTGILVSLSRASWIATPITFGFILITVGGHRLINLRNALIAIVAAGAVAVAAVYVYPIIRARMFGDDAGSEAQRIPLDLAAIYVIAKFPWFGVGLNNFAITFTTYDTTGAASVRPDVDYVVHNLYLYVWTEVGTVGFLVFLWYFGSVFLETFRLRRADPRIRAIVFGISAGLFAHLIHGLVDPGFKLNLTISQLIAAQIGIVGWMAMARRGEGAGVAARLQRDEVYGRRGRRISSFPRNARGRILPG